MTGSPLVAFPSSNSISIPSGTISGYQHDITKCRVGEMDSASLCDPGLITAAHQRMGRKRLDPSGPADEKIPELSHGGGVGEKLERHHKAGLPQIVVY